jgi:hypothetical protein
MYARLSVEARTRKFRSWADYIDRLLEYLPADAPSRAVIDARS